MKRLRDQGLPLPVKHLNTVFRGQRSLKTRQNISPFGGRQNQINRPTTWRSQISSRPIGYEGLWTSNVMCYIIWGRAGTGNALVADHFSSLLIRRREWTAAAVSTVRVRTDGSRYVAYCSCVLRAVSIKVSQARRVMDIRYFSRNFIIGSYSSRWYERKS